MDELVSGDTGLIHFIGASIALLSGTWVILTPKGTVIHETVGYLYAVSMTIMLTTSFMLYNLFGEFAIFHYFSVVSTLTLAGGMIPAITRRKTTWVHYHLAFMYWSVMGLYAAFVAEIITRVPSTPFFGMLGVAIFIVMTFAYLFWFKYKKNWMTSFGPSEKST